MKRIFTIAAAVLMTANVWAQSPEKMSYQAVVRDASNSLVTTTTVGMRISILQGDASGIAVYTETHTPETNANGLVSLEIGTGTSTDNFSDIDWANGPYFVKTETDPAGGTSYTITGTSQLLSVPYALHAKTAETLATDINLTTVLSDSNDAGGNGIVNTGTIAIGTDSPTDGAALEINSTTGALLLPRLSTEERDAISATPGMMVYNTSSHKTQVYGGAPAAVNQEQNIANGEVANAGQSFVAGANGNWTRLIVRSSGEQTGIVTIYEGTGMTGTILHSQAITVQGGFIDTELVLSSPVTLVEGQTYTFSTDITLRYSDDMTSYTEGTGYFQNTPVAGDLRFQVITGGSEWIDLH